jgi:hypothetical protein
VDIAWQEGKLTSATIRSINGKIAHLRYGTAKKDIEIAPGRSFQWDGK